MKHVIPLSLVISLAACSSAAESGDDGGTAPGRDAGRGDAGSGRADTGWDAGWQADFTVETLASDRATYALMEFKINYATSVPNPFDLEQVSVTAEFKRPSGDTDTVRGFWYQDYDLSQDVDGGTEALAKKDAPHFRVRYAPPEPGGYLYRITVTEGAAAKVYGWDSFSVVDSGSKGFVRINPTNAKYFGFGDGTLYFPVGYNVGWYGAKGYFDYEHYLDKMVEYGGNYFRMWLIKWSNALEWSPGKGNGDYGGLGRYALDNAYRVDRILRHAETKGIRAMVTFGSYLEHTVGGSWNEGSWPENPYNSANGGPCGDAGEFFTDAAAKRWYQNRLAYIVARWGYSTSVFSWELWNEVVAPPEWVRVMARYLKDEDLNRHLVSTTYGDDSVYNLRDVDYTQHHLYGSPDKLIDDYPQRVASTTAGYLSKYGKPFLLSEFGIDWSKGDEQWDPDATGVNWHNGVWGAVASGAAGTAMLWWWDSYIDPFDLYRILKPFPGAGAVLGGDLAGTGPIDLGQDLSAQKVIAYGTGNGTMRLVWIAALDSTWRNAYDKILPQGIEPFALKVPGFKKGCAMKAAVYNAWEGSALVSQDLTPDADGAVTVQIPAFQRDVYVTLKCY